VRQPWNFSPGDSARENEDYAVHLSEVGILELIITPDKIGGVIDSCGRLEIGPAAAGVTPNENSAGMREHH